MRISYSKSLLTSQLFFLHLLPSIVNGLVQDFCVADTNYPDTPAGYPCKKLSAVTVEDFVFPLPTPTNITGPFKFGVVTGFAPQFPGLNGLHISVARAYIPVGGAVPIHAHPAGTELILVAQGTVVAGFVSGAGTGNRVYHKTLNEGDSMVFPQGLLHFQANVGTTPVTLFISFNSQNPGLQITATSLFQNNFPSDLLERVTLIDDGEVKKLKSTFGGSG